MEGSTNAGRLCELPRPLCRDALFRLCSFRCRYQLPGRITLSLTLSLSLTSTSFVALPVAATSSLPPSVSVHRNRSTL
jgi:hypothetical protein